MRPWFKPKPLTPEPVPTDIIVPVPFFDGQACGRGHCSHYTYHFNEVLDKDKLRQSLERLMGIGGWWKLGARVRIKHDGKLEYHIPTQYTAKRPGFTYTTTEHQMVIGDHPIASKLPRSTGKPVLLGNTEDLASLCCHPDCPQRLDDWLYTDRPQLDVHVVVFHDATLITLSLMHMLMDAMATGDLLRAWSAVLSGHEDQVPDFRGMDEDLTAPHSTAVPADQYVYYDRWLRGFRLLLFKIRVLWELIRFRHEERRHICIPGTVIQAMRTRMLHELEQSRPKSAEVESIFLSESDVLLAWCTRTVLKSLRVRPSRPITLFNVFDTRSALLEESASDQPKTKTAFITNAILPSATFLPAEEILSRPLSSLAWQIRRSLIEQRTKFQCQAQVAAMRESINQSGIPALFAKPNSLLVSCSNWHRARFYDVDFSAAVVSAAGPGADRTNAIGKVAHIYTNRNTAGISMRNMGLVYGKDAAGDWWLTWTLRSQGWDVVQRELDTLGEEWTNYGTG